MGSVGVCPEAGRGRRGDLALQSGQADGSTAGREGTGRKRLLFGAGGRMNTPLSTKNLPTIGSVTKWNSPSQKVLSNWSLGRLMKNK